MRSIRKLAGVQLIVLIPFIFFKAIRSSVIVDGTASWIKIFLYSFPNFCEAIVGTMTICGLGLIANRRFLKPHHQLSNNTVYILAIFLAAIYVILQEFKVHNLGGNNVYDPNDVIFSLIGLGVAYLILLWLKPNILTSTQRR